MTVEIDICESFVLFDRSTVDLRNINVVLSVEELDGTYSWQRWTSHSPDSTQIRRSSMGNRQR